MKKFLLVFINIVIVVSVATVMYHSYRNELDSTLDIECEYNYLVISNTMSINCEVEDEDEIISSDNPLNIYIFDIYDEILYEASLSKGNNDLIIDELEYSSRYIIKINGYDYIKEDYIYSEYEEFAFSTASSNIIIPTYVFTENLITESEYHFSIDITDVENRLESIDITLFDNNNEILITNNYTEFFNLDFSFTELDPEMQYSIVVDIYYEINDFNELSNLSENKTFLTIEQQLSPIAVISNVDYDSDDLSFDLDTNNQDATEVLYTLELIDLQSNIIYSEELSNQEVILDVSGITGNYYISVKVSYTLNGSAYSDIEIDTYTIFSNDLFNFYLVPTVEVVNTELPLTNYDDYSDYIFTYLNKGASEFTIICEAPVDCAQLVTNDLYSEIPFMVTDLVHAYNDINTINYSYTSTQLNIVVGKEYTIEDIDLIDQEIDIILNSIITESMSDYDKILAVHDYIINNTVYDSNCFNNATLCDNDHTAKGVLFDHFAVCEGYAHTIDIMLRALQIPTFRLSSSTHQWSAVYYNDEWYHLDATWDDPVSSGGEDILVHTFFLISTSELNTEDSSSSHDYEERFVNFIQ